MNRRHDSNPDFSMRKLSDSDSFCQKDGDTSPYAIECSRSKAVLVLGSVLMQDADEVTSIEDSVPLCVRNPGLERDHGRRAQAVAVGGI